MRAKRSLPNGYREIFSVNLQTNKKMALIINIAALAISAIMIIGMSFYISVLMLFDMSSGILDYTLRFVVLLLAAVAYIILHELTHAAAMKFFGTKKVKFGYTGFYAFAGSDDYYDKKSYIIIALAPIVLWGIVLAVINVFVPENWFWVVYFVQICNISGAAGDIYVTAKFSKIPKDILIHDCGVGMTVYSAQ